MKEQVEKPIEVKDVTQVLKAMSDDYYSKAYPLIEAEIERLARNILSLNKRKAKEFVMCMGTYFFNNSKGVMWDHESELLLGYKELDDFISTHNYEFKITGIPMRFTSTGLKITDW